RGSCAHTAGVEVDEELGKGALDHLESGEARAKTVEIVEEQVRDRAVRAPRILRVVAGSRCVERVGGPVEPLVPGETERPLGGLPAVALLYEEVAAPSQHARGLVEKARRVGEMVDDVVRGARVD